MFVGAAVVTGFGLLGSALAVGTARRRYAAPRPVAPGSLRVNGDAAGTLDIGHHRVVLGADAFTVEDAEGRTVWSVPPGNAFLAAARCTMEWRETAGHFSFERTLSWSLADQSIERVERGGGTEPADASTDSAPGDGISGPRPGANGLVLYGRLTSGASGGYDYTLRLRSREDRKSVV